MTRNVLVACGVAVLIPYAIAAWVALEIDKALREVFNR